MPELKFAKKAVNNPEVLNYIAQTYINAINAWRTRRVTTEKAFAYVEGGSFSYSGNSNIVAALTKQEIPTLKIPIIFPRIQRILGYEQELRGRIIASSTHEEGDDESSIATQLLDWANQPGRYNRDDELSSAFKDALIGDMGGYIEVDWNTDNDILGIPTYRHIPSLHILPDPAFPLYHVQDHRFIIKHMMMSVDQAIAQFPNKRDEIQMVVGNIAGVHRWQQMLQDWWAAIKGTGEILRNEFVDFQENMVRVIEMQERRRVNETILVNVQTGEQMIGLPDEDVEQVVATNSMFVKITRKRDEIWTHTSLADYVLLQSVKNDVQNGMFSIIPLAGYDFGGRNSGLVSKMFGVQEEVELARSAELHILHTQAASGYIYEKTALDADMKDRLERSGASAGLIIELEPGAMGRFQKIQPAYPPAGEITRADRALRDADVISSIGEGELGRSEPGGESGILHRQRVTQAMITLKTLFTNLDRTRQMLGEYTLALMEARLHPARIPLLIGNQPNLEQVVVNGKLDFGKYKVKVRVGANTETQRMQRLLEVDSLLQRMPPDLIPYHLIIKLLDWPDKKEWEEYIMQRLGLGQNQQAQFSQALRGDGNGAVNDELLAKLMNRNGVTPQPSGDELADNELLV